MHFWVIGFCRSFLEIDQIFAYILWNIDEDLCALKYGLLTLEQKMNCKNVSYTARWPKNVGIHVPVLADMEEISTSALQMHPQTSDPFLAAASLDPLSHTQNDFLFPPDKHSSRCMNGRYLDHAPVADS